MDGIINVLKPPGMTSFDIVGYLRGILRIKKIGHTGTLDPGATGVLPVCIGRATKAIEYLTEKDKLYRAELTLGVSTDTQDSSGKATGFYDIELSTDKIKNVILSFIGSYEQLPPMYSAVKVGGVRLYELAREGITVERKARRVQIYSIDIKEIDFCEGFYGDHDIRRQHRICKVIFDVSCSKGTYIRTICSDIGERLGCGGHMSFLIRLSTGSFDIDSAYTVEEIGEAANRGEINRLISGVDTVFEDYGRVYVNETDAKKLLNGLTLDAKYTNFEKETVLAVYNDKEVFLALGKIITVNGAKYLKTVKVF